MTSMKKPPLPPNEEQRLATLRALNILDTKPEEQFDFLIKITAKLFDVPIAAISLVDKDREWYKASCGLPEKEGPRAISFCAHAILTDEVFIVEDTMEDPRFADNPYVVDEPHIRFYAGAVLKGPNNEHLGAFCIKDTKPRSFSQKDMQILEGMAHWAELGFNATNVSKDLLELKLNYWKLQNKIEELQNKLTKELNTQMGSKVDSNMRLMKATNIFNKVFKRKK